MRLSAILAALLVPSALLATEPPKRQPLQKSDLTPPLGAKQFCDGRVYPPGGRPHLSWWAYATTAKRTDVRKAYLKRLGTANHERAGDVDIWRVPPKKPEKVLSVYPATYDKGPWRRCKLPPGTRTIVEISVMPR